MNNWTKVVLVGGASLYFLHKLKKESVKKESEIQDAYNRMFVGIVEHFND